MKQGLELERKLHICAGIVAHVDSGKTTLSEAMLYETGQIRKLGRVDHQDAFLDTDSQERERGITIFSKQARIQHKGVEVTLLDTPGHVDFSAEMERTLQVLDCAILVISGIDGVQSHTRTLWKLLKHYQIPTIIFVNKMDVANMDAKALTKQLKAQLSEGCVDVSACGDEAERMEEIAVCHEDLLEKFMEEGTLSDDDIQWAFSQRYFFPCYYGSALKLEGIKELLDGLVYYGQGRESLEATTEDAFGGLVYKIGRDARGARLTFLKVTQGTLRVKDKVSYQGQEEKIDQIRLYNGERFETVEQVTAGRVCCVLGLDQTAPGMGIGANTASNLLLLEPVLNYQIIVPQGVSPVELYGKLRQLEEEDPQLHLLWNDSLQEICAQLMGQVQKEVLGRSILERFGVRVEFGPGNIVYKETIAKPVEGVGHYEPLRHYAEVHLWMEPGEPGSGINVYSECSEDVLDLNWQRLITTHILEREHPGVLTGSSITDVKFTIVTGRAHLKHTEGGDFRQATYRAIRQGLKSTESILLEPYYNFVLDIPADQVGRAMTDIRNRFGKHEAPEYVMRSDGDRAILTGSAPVATMQDYMTEVHAYSKGSGSLSLELKGYDVCHNSTQVVEERSYDSEADTANPTSSVFCAHGAGFVVPWNEVPSYMHLEYAYDPEKGMVTGGLSYDLEEQARLLREQAEQKEAKRQAEKAAGSNLSWEMDGELQKIYAREFGMSKDDMIEYERKKWAKKTQSETKAPTLKYDKKGNPIYPKKANLEELLIVDGYNIIFAWPDLKELARTNIDAAKDSLKDILSDYQGFKGGRILVVFDGYRVKGNKGSLEKYFDLEVAHTKQDETADMYIERTVHETASKYKITVATSDNLEQLTILSMGALRMSADMLRLEVDRVRKQGMEAYLNK